MADYITTHCTANVTNPFAKRPPPIFATIMDFQQNVISKCFLRALRVSIFIVLIVISVIFIKITLHGTAANDGKETTEKFPAFFRGPKITILDHCQAKRPLLPKIPSFIPSALSGAQRFWLYLVIFFILLFGVCYDSIVIKLNPNGFGSFLSGRPDNSVLNLCPSDEPSVLEFW